MTSISVVCLSHAIAGKVGLVESPRMHHKDGLIDHAYVQDEGGAHWRQLSQTGIG